MPYPIRRACQLSLLLARRRIRLARESISHNPTVPMAIPLGGSYTAHDIALDRFGSANVRLLGQKQIFAG